MTDDAGAEPQGDAPASRPAENEDASPRDEEAFQPAASEGLLDEYRPGGRTFQADPAVRDFEQSLSDTGRLRQLSTGQLLIVGRPEAPVRETGVLDETEQRRVYSAVAAVTGVVGVLASLFVGWMVPISIAAIIFGVLGLRRERGRAAALVGIYAGVVGVLFSAIWLGYYLITFGVLPS